MLNILNNIYIYSNGDPKQTPSGIKVPQWDIRGSHRGLSGLFFLIGLLDLNAACDTVYGNIFISCLEQRLGDSIAVVPVSKENFPFQPWCCYVLCCCSLVWNPTGIRFRPLTLLPLSSIFRRHGVYADDSQINLPLKQAKGSHQTHI